MQTRTNLHKWLWLLNKRLYKKATFLVLLLIIPALTLLLSLLAGQESGFLHISLASAAEGENALADAVIDELLGSSEFIIFTKYDSIDEAAETVRDGRADAAWLFPADFEQRLLGFSGDSKDGEAALTVMEREQTTPLRLSHEKLTSALYKYCSRSFYLRFIRSELPILDGVSEDTLLGYYEEIETEESMFAFESATSSGETVESGGYLLAPVRGLLSIVVVLAGLAAALFSMQDEQKGTFSFLPYSKKPYLSFVCGMIAVCNVAAVMLLSLLAAGIFISPLREFGAMLLFGISCTLFGMLLRQLLGSIQSLCTLLPLLTVVMIVMCPIFFNIRSFSPALAPVLEPLQLLFPPTYYVRAIYQNEYFLYMALYSLAMAALCALLGRLRRQAI